MGRAKVVMEAIKDDKKRNITFQRRKENMIKKALELTTLCDVNISIILCTTDKDQQPQIFPQDSHHKLKTLIDLYRTKCITSPREIGSHSCSNLSDFFIDRKIKIEQELAKAKKKNLEAKYPTWFDFLNHFSQGQLREFALGLDRKIDHVQTKKSSIPKNLDPTMDYNNVHHSVNNLTIEQQLNLVTEFLMNDDDNFDTYFQPPPEAVVNNNFPAMEYNNNCSCYYDHQCDLFINQPYSNPSSLTEIMVMGNNNNCSCNYDHNFGVQPPPQMIV